VETGSGDLDIDLRLAANNSWIASSTGSENPKSIPTSLTEGTSYAIAVWAASGLGTFTLSVTGPGGGTHRHDDDDDDHHHHHDHVLNGGTPGTGSVDCRP
jgi:hypothetical protein